MEQFDVLVIGAGSGMMVAANAVASDLKNKLPRILHEATKLRSREAKSLYLGQR
jgi:pyruvate/2-oxoglutarate dehydrogenase complex dihydrolipoamide dehydrogenase (E3) component